MNRGKTKNAGAPIGRLNTDLKKNRKNDLTKNRGRTYLKRNDEQRMNEERWSFDWTIEHWVGD